MIASGVPVPDADVWLAPGDGVRLPELTRDGAVLLLFYVFDWSST